ncbi:putative secreted protein (Por secretion system target) [Flavobacterium sp. 1]|uniref:LamG-like jellyroll fold domain-containing protein n=1 Tax=Flavobacterium sp. 1 TaxID=2035200 RepID=UPI000C2359F4|nr:LamG-like jellyroll fold domain-containing protein [Flavobacterium sp. 1]PJJ07308.1 putative secreted protein (Por secretion system target) [Flavobacterium sp. 1]
MRQKYFLLGVLLLGFGIININAQSSTSDNLIAQPITDNTVPFSVLDNGISAPVTWGLDTAWPDENNMRRGVSFMGKENVDIVRISFQPTRELVNGEFQSGNYVGSDGKTYSSQTDWLDKRLALVALTGENTKVAFNCDHPFVASWFSPADRAVYAARWEQLIYASTKYAQGKGRTVVSVAPFNEPDNGWGQGTVSNFNDIAARLKTNPYFSAIRVSGGNTLNCDLAHNWYDQLKSNLDEGNTHQLAGGFDGYASFFEKVRSDGKHATADELHNVMEAIVGIQYGMQTGIWWGTAELARGEFVKASRNGKRLAYAENRPKWTAAAVYKTSQGNVQAFGGTSERQAVATSYRFISKDKEVYFDGYGPQREYTMQLPGGTGYQKGQTNAERVVNITWGDDIQPVINGRYILVNRKSGKVLEVENGSYNAGSNIRQYNYNSSVAYQQWNVTPVDSRIGGDFSYFTITAQHSGMSLDIYNFSLEDGGNIVVWNDLKSANQQWYLDYVEDGWFYIHSRFSAKCLQVASTGDNIEQSEKSGGTQQQWRLIPIGVPIDFVSPSAPGNLTATANTASIRLDWTPSTDTDVAGYTVFRAESKGGSYNTIARNIKTTSFVDNTTATGKPYFYVIKAIDNSLNRSVYSNEASATATGNKDIIAHFQFDDNTLDKTIQLNHSASYGDIAFVEGKIGSKAISLKGTNGFLQLPANVANHDDSTIAAWVNWKGGNEWQRIFDFGNGVDENMFLTTNAYGGNLRFVIKNANGEIQMETAKLATSTWVHVAVTISKTQGLKMYVDGKLVKQLDNSTVSPNDFKPILNYIGRSQYTADPLFNGSIDDFRIYNYALSENEIAALVTNNLGVDSNEMNKGGSANVSLWPVPANEVLSMGLAEMNSTASALVVYDMQGKIVMNKTYSDSKNIELDTSYLPSGTYILKLKNDEKSVVKQFIVRH